MSNSKEINDSQLVQSYQSGNKKALVLLVNRWHKKFCTHAYWYTNDRDLAKDIAQESWTVIINKIGGLQNTNKFGAWALQIVTRKAIDSYRKRNNFKNLDDYQTEKLIANTIENDADLSKSVLIAIQKLSSEQQAVLRLFYIQEYKINQIASLLKIPKGTVKSRLFKARERLKLILKPSKEN